MKRRTGGTKLWATLSKQATRSARQFSRTVSRTVTDPMVRAARQQGQAVSKAMGRAVGKVARQALTGVVTPARVPVSKSGGSWEEGLWGFSLGIGSVGQRRYRVFVPPGVSAARPAPLLVLLHGCGQDAASFAACARVAKVARDARWVVLMPEQSVHANAQRCWNWFRPAARGASETALLMSMIDHVSQRYAILAHRVCAFGLSAGGAMAMMLGLRYPDRFAAIGSHSGAAPFSAINATQAPKAMRGDRAPDAVAARLALAGRSPPPLLLLHGDEDSVVSYDNATSTAAMWLELLPPGTPAPRALPARRVRRGTRRAVDVFDWQAGPRPYLRVVKVEGLRHAWSGGAPGQAFSDPSGPDALKIALRFFSVNGRQRE
ncbi:Poly(3-hydroxyalkanoate) depolymerase [Cupriavidus sp. U2]|uniref:extracellular catalytic domain type 1 short-chain-length polyhydroxyalkanoate depolymerase n=1 Tax=Cupriavidus sp. U2 TaxID=2920269 RepID=UPI00129D93EF|nr:PHB depolymerase family esterase [Cupriavidus sp. U2]KAI3593730.1 Poly(3-hydroxyalkanoate) depolymerase [Cupriavidus sp. U2]